MAEYVFAKAKATTGSSITTEDGKKQTCINSVLKRSFLQVFLNNS
jgi:hypothetical protein